MRAKFGVKVVALAMSVFFLFPTIVVAVTSFGSGRVIRFPPRSLTLEWHKEIFTDDRWTHAFANSLMVAVPAAVIAMVVGTALAFGAARVKLLPGPIITGLAMAPVIVPGVVLSVGFYFVAVRVGLTGNVLGLALAHAAIGVPFVFVNVLACLTSMDPQIEEAARVSGASDLVTLVLVTLRIALPSMAIGGVLAFIGSWDEFMIASFLNSPTFHTVPVVVFGEVLSGADPSTSAASTVITVVSILMLGLAAGLPSLAKRRTKK
jgi:putative spermidine/putrescine transport system permease protein